MVKGKHAWPIHSASLALIIETLMKTALCNQRMMS